MDRGLRALGLAAMLVLRSTLWLSRRHDRRRNDRHADSRITGWLLILGGGNSTGLSGRNESGGIMKTASEVLTGKCRSCQIRRRICSLRSVERPHIGTELICNERHLLPDLPRQLMLPAHPKSTGDFSDRLCGSSTSYFTNEIWQAKLMPEECADYFAKVVTDMLDSIEDRIVI